MKKKVFFTIVSAALLLPVMSMAQIHIYVDVPTGDTYSDTGSAPAASVELFDWELVEGFGELTGTSVRSLDTADFTADTVFDAAYFEVTVNIPEAGEWFLWASYSFPYPDANAVWILDPAANFIGSPDGPTGPDAPAPFLNTRAGDFNNFFWGGADAGSNAVNADSKGAPLGTLPAGEYTLQIYTNETFEGVSGGSGSGAEADHRRNPHIEMLYLSNGGADDVPSDPAFLALMPFSGMREMNPPVYSAQGGYVNVSVSIRPEASTSGAVTVTENLPSGLPVDQITASSGTASESDGIITWEVPDIAGGAALTYRLKIDSGILETFRISGSISGGGNTQAISGQSDIGLLSFFIFETFSFPADNSNANEGKSVAEVDEPLGGGNTVLDRGWANGGWTATDANDKLDTRIIDAGLVASQPQEYNPGNFSLMMDGAGGDAGVRRDIAPVSFGEFWVSFTFVEEGPAAQHWAGLSFFDSEGAEQTFVGKIWDTDAVGLANLPGGDLAAEGIAYNVPHHYLVRYVLDPAPGQNDDAFLWIDPDKTDDLGTYDAGGKDVDDITNLATIRLSRGGAGGAAWWDNIFISSVGALPPAGSGRVALNLNPENPDDRPPTAWDVISIDQIDDGETGAPYGHDNGDNHYLIVSGFLYWENADGSGNQLVGYGLPADRMSGLNGHLLEPFNNQFDGDLYRNSFKFEGNDEQDGPFTLDVVPPGNYAQLRAAMTVANGDGQLFATFNYEDGTTGTGFIHADDWYNDPPNLDFADTFLLVNGMNRLDGSDNFDGRFNPGVFENVVEVDPSKVLVSVTLELDPSVNSNPGYNLFDILAVPPQEEEPTPVLDWMLLQ